MEKHPLPQHISSYEFRLVGEMTLKQFGFLAGGAIVAFLFYISRLPWYFKWPLIIGSSSLGAGMAFVPINDQPLNRWLLIFFKAIFSPTLFVWEKKSQAPEFLQPKPQTTTPPKVEPLVSPPTQAKPQLEEFLASLTTKKLDEEKEAEKQRLARLSSLFQSIKGKTYTYPSSAPLPPKAQAQPREIKVSLSKPAAQPPTPPPPHPIKPVQVGPGVIPSQKPVVLPEHPGRAAAPTVEAKTSVTLPIPIPPTQPNILSGMVLDSKGEIVEGAILEIRNNRGLPVRALKTNKLGQFRIATPLENGVYTMETEKDGCRFDIIKITLEGKIINPLEIKAQGPTNG